MDGDLRSRVVTLENQGISRESRLAALEAWRTQRDIESARHDERWKHMDDRFNRLEMKIAGVSESLSRIMWAVVTAIIIAIVGFMIRGGFSP